MKTLQKIKKIKRIREHAIAMRRDLHGRKDQPLFAKEFEGYGKVIEEANKAIFELEELLEIEKL